MENVSVVIVNWNVNDSLKRCLRSVLDTKHPDLEVIVIDNASTDGSAQAIQKLREIILIKNKTNLGFPKAVNQGLKVATGDYILILNPDTRIPKDFFDKAIEFIKTHPDAGVMGPKLVNADGTSQGSVFQEPSIFGSNQKYTPMNREPIAVNAISGSCMFMPRSTLEKVGKLTEEVFMYYEDLDYCRRIRQAGLKVYFDPEITVVHEHGQSAKQNPQVMDWRGQLWKSSLWYNGPIKHNLMWLVSFVRQKLGM